MFSNALKESKGVIIFLLLFIIFSYFAIIRVDHLEKENFNHEVYNKVAYNK